jgi:mono/diheme cytochrome c family protein
MRVLILLTALSWWPFTNAAAENSEVGRAIAVETCSRCHAVLPGEGIDPAPYPLPFTRMGKPLPFEDIASMPNVSEMTLYDWLTSSHPTMPYIVIEEDELTSLVAYILSLKRKSP